MELLKAVNKLQIQDVKYADKIISGISTALNKLDGFAQSVKKLLLFIYLVCDAGLFINNFLDRGILQKSKDL